MTRLPNKSKIILLIRKKHTLLDTQFKKSKLTLNLISIKSFPVLPNNLNAKYSKFLQSFISDAFNKSLQEYDVI